MTVGVFIVQFYIFGVIGQWCFSGVIYEDNPALVDTDYAKSNYFLLYVRRGRLCSWLVSHWARFVLIVWFSLIFRNFNDFGSSCLTMFVITINNNWVCYLLITALQLLR